MDGAHVASILNHVPALDMVVVWRGLLIVVQSQAGFNVRSQPDS